MTIAYRRGHVAACLEDASYAIFRARDGVDVLSDEDCRKLNQARELIAEVLRGVWQGGG